MIGISRLIWQSVNKPSEGLSRLYVHKTISGKAHNIVQSYDSIGAKLNSRQCILGGQFSLDHRKLTKPYSTPVTFTLFYSSQNARWRTDSPAVTGSVVTPTPPHGNV